MRSFERHRQPRRHEYDGIAQGRELLVQHPGFVGEPARQRVDGNDPEADLVRYQHTGPRQRREYVEEQVRLALQRLRILAAEQVGEPERETVDDHGARRTRIFRERSGEPNRFLDEDPVRRAAHSMRLDSSGHFLVEDPCRCNQRYETSVRTGEFGRVAALAGADTGQDERLHRASLSTSTRWTEPKPIADCENVAGSRMPAHASATRITPACVTAITPTFMVRRMSVDQRRQRCATMAADSAPPGR